MTEAGAVLVSLYVPPTLEESVVDCLLTFESEYGFSCSTVFFHDHKNEGMSVAEQVSGRQKKTRFQMMVNTQELPKLVHKLRETYSGSGINYWVTPVIDNGKI